ncbi:MAG TPA: histidinol-phosphate transaminase [Sediminibacterium sp.]|jgi:histidinol-phosphate aminotransferase|uniref:histidinol-phosphate transaminase n=1 Tax=Sediminibacterium sp. TaxID=1917865 RepID=UPI0008C98A38|nr:histidinol-phosphate transaminase [Sediminibacterium sp.]OHC85358.1 MAG: histidinol-phosphate transaminase [Sphingobacteriia bacterium RIFOXYC2_FULL_35_18]OHC89405.1 MAG: histidinol-phosphate transaminase [Sphingobacteriia bacterium RIFOXYD2_FULL_35_12]OYY09443.1 MAG: histidinol-phosphate transaminase [Sphingobacteriia bacterium 35-36-14]OYZ53763.1 MAG: histidinol-phosphate transaminase [Sphingobacteriia bacterium 24-36-13]OZA62531.1 MAG: histidinol-phosphate transaminase [Sphingobacteriia 
MLFNLNDLVRPNIAQLTPYSSARDEYSGEAKVFLDANENSLGSPLPKWYNRYPDPHQVAVKNKLAVVKGITAEHIFLGNGSDECIDLLYRSFCIPSKDNVIICPPTYGMYEVSAHINDIELKKIPLLPSFQLNLVEIEQAIDSNTKLIWICSPNNPTGNSINRIDIETILNNFKGIVIIDEAYINFSKQKSFVQELTEYPNLVVLQTFSKAWGLAGLRLGMAFASTAIIEVLNRVKPPYNINQSTQELALKALEEVGQVNDMIRLLVDMRDALADVFNLMPTVQEVYPSDANFLLVKIKDARKVYEFLLTKGIVLRDRSNVQLCNDCLRITVGSEHDNTILVEAMQDWYQLNS